MPAPALLEVLAPAGDPSCLEAALSAGADAVYLGLGAFNARARARNFELHELGPAMERLHAHGRRGYVTLNTLVYDDELEELERVVRACAAAGVDAVIVQDLGVARLVRAIAPTLELHASTQLTCADASAVTFAAELGMTRVTLARELSVDEIASIAQESGVELEVFVHGALCISYSGQCLASHALGGRSANRGECAQPCRLPYQLLLDGARAREHAFLLSPQDLEATRFVPELARIGVRAMKIEGRLKSADYVSATARLYRQAADAVHGCGAPPADDLRAAALQTFTRGSGPGFLAGVNHQALVEARGSAHRGVLLGELAGVRHRGRATWLDVRLLTAVGLGDGLLVEGGTSGAAELGGRVWRLEVSGSARQRAEPGERALVWLGPERRADGARRGQRVFKSGHPERPRASRATMNPSLAGRRLELRVSGELGGTALLEARTADGRVAEARIVEVLESTRSLRLDRERVRAQLSRLGGTPFELGMLSVELPPDAFVPASALNRARREIVAKLLRRAHRAHPTTESSARKLLDPLEDPPRPELPGGLFVLCRTHEQARAALEAGASGVVLELGQIDETRALFEALRAQTERPLGLCLPRVRRPGERRLDSMLLGLSPDTVLVRSLGSLYDLSRTESPPALIGDASLNVTNQLSAAAVLARGLGAFTPSHELGARGLLTLLSARLAPRAEVVIHQHTPLFHSEHCVFAARLSTGTNSTSCGRPCERHRIALRDRMGVSHPVLADITCRNTVFHSAPRTAARLIPELRRAGILRFRIELLGETAEETTRLVDDYAAVIRGEAAPKAVLNRIGRAAGGCLHVLGG